MEHEKLPVWKALPVFSSDALSSVAYATEEILLILVSFSFAATVWSIPIALTIAALLIIVSLSYRQTISLYPNGGGAYTVAKENLGQHAGLLAGASLLIDYILTVAVSISAGVAAIVSAFPGMHEYTIPLALLLVFVMTFLNLRGVRESSFIFAIPTYFFIACLMLLLVVGFWRSFLGEQPVKMDLIHDHYPEISIFLILRAFASGCAALTGIEAISNGVPAFKNPAVGNAKRTLSIMVVLLAFSFMAITMVAHIQMIAPRAGETMLSQIARFCFGDSILYYAMQASTALILVLAANTAFADFPRLTSILGKDRYLPRQLSNIGDRLVFSNGIVSLGFAAAALIYLFHADTHKLIPLYSVGVFLSFTLSKSSVSSSKPVTKFSLLSNTRLMASSSF
jgi:amino acid transporter